MSFNSSKPVYVGAAVNRNLVGLTSKEMIAQLASNLRTNNFRYKATERARGASEALQHLITLPDTGSRFRYIRDFMSTDSGQANNGLRALINTFLVEQGHTYNAPVLPIDPPLLRLFFQARVLNHYPGGGIDVDAQLRIVQDLEHLRREDDTVLLETLTYNRYFNAILDHS